MAMHPALSERLTLEQLNEAFARPNLSGPEVTLEEGSYPFFFIRFATVSGSHRLLRFDATDYDFQPLDLDLVDPVTRAALAPSAWLIRDGKPCPPHPLQNGRPFLCLSGTRSYYTHPNHSPRVTRERWERHRQAMPIGVIISSIRDRFAAGRWI